MPERSSNPAYNNAHGAAIQAGAPPFDLEDVVMRVFPLRASFNSLQLFCNRYLNIAPEFAWFEPVAPFVLLDVINYGRMGRAGSSFSYTSQNEVIFAIPVNWYRVEGGRRILKGQASVSPFIWVDEASSVWTGREVFGWPKNLSWLTPGVDAWMKDPRSRRTLFTLSSMVFHELFAGKRQEPGLLFEIEEEQPEALFEAPPDAFNALNPMLVWPKAVLNALRIGGDVLESMARLPMRGFPTPGRGASLPEMISQAFGNFDVFRQLPANNTINLKQFRDPEQPQNIAYQALTNSVMSATSLNRGGLLGEPALLRGDASGGYRIRVHRHPGWPIIESLGLQVASESSENGTAVAVLEPVLPFWVDVDFEYGAGEVICWRTHKTHWAPPPRLGSPAPEPDPKLEPEPDPELEAEPQTEDPATLPPCSCKTPHLYNLAEGGALQQVYGPFHFPNVTTRVLPLLADYDRLRTFCDDYLNDGRPTLFVADGHPVCYDGDSMGALAENLFVPWGRYVYMTITSFEEVTSEVNLGWWANRRVTFSFPVRWYKKEDKKWGLRSFGLVSPFMYADTGAAASTAREMMGWPMAEAEIENPPHAWLDDGGPIRSSDVMSLKTEVLPAINANQKTESEVLIEVTGRDPLEETDWNGWKHVAADWGEQLLQETIGKARWSSESKGAGGWSQSQRLRWLKSAGLEVLVNDAPINHISLKQFRDAEDPRQACYQAINLYPETLERVHDLREIDHRMHVAIHRYPTQPIVKTLGLQVKCTDTHRGQPVDYLQPIRPFWLKADMSADLGRDVLWRAGSKTWHEGVPTELYFDAPDGIDKPAPVANCAGWFDEYPHELQDFKSDHVRDLVRERAQEEWSGDWWESRSQHRKMLSQDARETKFAAGHTSADLGFAPQVAIESILSKRWLNFGIPMTLGHEEKQKLAGLPAANLRIGEGPKQRPGDYPDSHVRKDTIGHPDVREQFEERYKLGPPDGNRWIVRPKAPDES